MLLGLVLNLGVSISIFSIYVCFYGSGGSIVVCMVVVGICFKMGIGFGWMRLVVVLGVAVEAGGVCVVLKLGFWVRGVW